VKPTREYSALLRQDGLGEKGRFKWIHLHAGTPVPPISDGSFNYLIWDLIQRHPKDHLLITPHYEESVKRASENQASIVFIEFKKRFRLVELAKHYLIQKPLNDSLDFYDEAFRCIEETDCPNILVWGTMRPIPFLRWRFPDRTIAYAQRYFEHSYDVSSYYNYCDIVLTQTYGEARYLFDKHFAVHPLILHIPNGVELEKFHPVSSERKCEIRSSLGIDENKFVVLFPSKLNPNKGTSYLLYWLEYFLGVESKVHFLLVGDWHQGKIRGNARRLLQLLEKARNVTWIRALHRDEMPPMFQAADICLMPGVWREGMSMAALEALASGLPLVCTKRGIYPEIIKHEYNGLLCAPEQLYRDGIAAIQRLLEDVTLRQSISGNVRMYAEMRLPRERCLQNFECFFAGNYLDIDSDLSIPCQKVLDRSTYV